MWSFCYALKGVECPLTVTRAGRTREAAGCGGCAGDALGMRWPGAWGAGPVGAGDMLGMRWPGAGGAGPVGAGDMLGRCWPGGRCGRTGDALGMCWPGVGVLVR